MSHSHSGFQPRNRHHTGHLEPKHRSFPLLQPQSALAPEPPLPRDRYRRAPRHYQVEESMHDIFNGDEEQYVEPPLDAFDLELLDRPYPDRARQAELGHARLSLGPSSARFVDPDPTQAIPSLSFHDNDTGGGCYNSHPAYPQAASRDFSRFAYNNTPDLPEASSETRGCPSSPTFRASQRRKENNQPGDSDPPNSTQIRSDAPPATGKGDSRLGHNSESGIGNRSTELLSRRPSLRHDVGILSSSQPPQRAAPNREQLSLSHAPPVAQGIPLVPVSVLPDRLRTVFPFPLFNAIQSKCFETIFKSEDNFVLSSPTGSGKTAILEIAICQAINKYVTGQYKIVYQAPTKSLCSERERDWQKKFAPLGLQCVELTGDSDATNLRNVRDATIIITTPEKWDSLTRKWKDHERLMRLIRLFLIDEVHILKDPRGATLEAVVSRMKSMETNVRFVALSATVPNFSDVAVWLGKNSFEHNSPAPSEKFGEAFRPVKLRKHVCGYHCHGNDFSLDKMLDSKLPEVIQKYSQRKPIMVFCHTRNSTVATAKALANWWATRSPRDRYWNAPSNILNFTDKSLRECAAAGVAFHHAGMELSDRVGVENGFLKGDLNVICCTSTLAVGVNLPCHFVIIKNTVSWTQNGPMEYADLEIMQMLGRAGRPQFDDSAVAVIMTRSNKVRRYEQLVTGQEVLESNLHLNLIEHLNAEVGLGTISSLSSARKWLGSTFLYVRLKQNPEYYKLEGSRSGQKLDEQLDAICNRDITLLQESNFLEEGEHLKCTELGDAMARYYVQFETMRGFVSLPSKAKISEIISALAQASEYKEVRFRSGEKPFYKQLNQNPAIRFPMQVDLSLPAHKVSLIFQSVLGAVPIAWNDQANNKVKAQYTTEVSIIFKHAHRLIRAIIDCQLYFKDSIAARNALMLERSVGALVWDDSPLQMKQLDQIGTVAVRKLATAGIKSLEELELTEPHRIEMLLSRNPPFGMRLLSQLKEFPKLRISITMILPSPSKTDQGVRVRVKLDIGFMNEKPVERYKRKYIMVSILTETSDGRKLDFSRISGTKLGAGKELIQSVLLTDPDQSITCYVMCDEIAGTMREATIKPKIPPSMFPAKPQTLPSSPLPHPISNTSCRRSDAQNGKIQPPDGSDEFGDDGIDDADLVRVPVLDLDFDHIDNYPNPTVTLTRDNTAKNAQVKSHHQETENRGSAIQLENGRWACNHKCKDKTICKHMCCREGKEKPCGRASSNRSAPPDDTASQLSSKKTVGKQQKTQTKPPAPPLKRIRSEDIETLDLTQSGAKKHKIGSQPDDRRRRIDAVVHMPSDIRNLHKLSSSVQKMKPPASVSSVMHKKPTYCYVQGGDPALSFMGEGRKGQSETSQSDYGDFPLDELSISQIEASEPEQIKRGGVQGNKNAVDGPAAGEYAATSDIGISSDTFEDVASSAQEMCLNQNQLHAERIGNSSTIRNEEPDDMFDENEKDLQNLAIPFEPGFGEDEEDDSVDIPQKKILSGGPLFISEFTSSSALGTSPVKSQPPVLEAEQWESKRGGLNSSRTSFDCGPSLREMGFKGTAADDATESEQRGDNPVRENDGLDPADTPIPATETVKAEEKADASKLPPGYEDLEPWFLAEFGDIVEIT